MGFTRKGPSNVLLSFLTADPPFIFPIWFSVCVCKYKSSEKAIDDGHVAEDTECA